MKIDEHKTAEDLVMMVIKRMAPACILISEGGLGKSYLVQTLLKENCPKNSVYHTGHITPLALYKLLHDNQNKIIVLDDMEELMANDTAIGILKPALWKVKNERKISWGTTSDKLGGYPQQFTFSGGVILLCNEIKRENHPLIQALLSRTLSHKIELTFEQKLNIMKQILDDESFYRINQVELSKDERERLKHDLENNVSLVTKNFNLRTLVKFVMFYDYGKKYYPNNPNRHIELHNATNTIDDDKKIIVELMDKSLSVAQQVQQFTEKTGKSRATYFRMKEKLMKDMNYKKPTAKKTEPQKTEQQQSITTHQVEQLTNDIFEIVPSNPSNSVEIRLKLTTKKLKVLLKKLCIVDMFPSVVIIVHDNYLLSIQREQHGRAYRFAKFEKNFFEEIQGDKVIEFDTEKTLNLIKSFHENQTVIFETTADNKLLIKRMMVDEQGNIIGEEEQIELSYKKPEGDIFRKLPFDFKDGIPVLVNPIIALDTVFTINLADLKSIINTGNKLKSETYKFFFKEGKIVVRAGELHVFSDCNKKYVRGTIVNGTELSVIFSYGIPNIANSFSKDVLIYTKSDCPGWFVEKMEDYAIGIFIPPYQNVEDK